MFADSMLETSWAQRSRRSWMTLTSFGLQALVVGLLLLLPLIRPVALPFMRPLPTPISMTVPAGPPPIEPQTRTATVRQSNLLNNVLMQPAYIPSIVAIVTEEPTAPQVGPGGPYAPAGTGGGPDGVPYWVGNPSNPLPSPPPVPKPATPPIRISHMMEGNLIRRVQPAYPPLARSARIQGQVVLVAVITKEGMIENLRVVEGHPMLVRAAFDAVSQWRYRPYILNNEPVEVETRITVNFSLSGS